MNIPIDQKRFAVDIGDRESFIHFIPLKTAYHYSNYKGHPSNINKNPSFKNHSITRFSNGALRFDGYLGNLECMEIGLGKTIGTYI